MVQPNESAARQIKRDTLVMARAHDGKESMNLFDLRTIGVLPAHVEAKLNAPTDPPVLIGR